MSHVCKITVTRREEWVNTQSLIRGENVPKTIVVPVDICKLSDDSRKILYAAGGDRFPATFDWGFNRLYELTVSYAAHGRSPIVIDSDAPSPSEIDAAIAAVAADLAARKATIEAEANAKLQAERDAAAAWAELPLHERATLDGVRQGGLSRQVLELHCPSALNAAQEEARQLRDIEVGKRAIEDRNTLSDFLAQIPDDALRGTLKRLASSEDRIAELRKKIEDASPVTIFPDDEDSDD